jgi:hypothetical protein
VKRLFALLLVGCGGPAVQFDAAPAPGWVKAPPSELSGGAIGAVGSAPATLDAARDTDLASRDAKTRVAQLFQSQVVSRTSDWTMASSGGAKDSERNVQAQSVDVRTNVKVEDVVVESVYRDETTKTVYVKVAVDRAAWSKRLDGRLGTSLGEMSAKADSAKSALAAKRALPALEAVIKGYEIGRNIETDVLVMDLLDTRRGVGAKLSEQRRVLEESSKKLRTDHAFVLEVKGPKEAASRLTTDLKTFLGSYGFALTDKPKAGAVRIVATLGEKMLKSEMVAGRDEKIHGAVGSIEVVDADGSTVAPLAIELGEGRFTERDVDDKAAGAKALALAADTLGSMFRSAFRKNYPLEQ